MDLWGAVVAAFRWLGSALAKNAVARFVVQLAITVAIGAALRALQPKPRGMDQGAQLETKIDAAYPREVAVGKFATGGSEAWTNVSGTDNKYLWRVIVLSDAEIEEITEVRGNGAALTFSGDIHTGLRDCTSHFQSASGADMLACRIYKGTSTQAVDPDLDTAFTDIDSNFRLRGCAYAVLRLTYDPDAWAGAADFVFVGKGAKCWDPRTQTAAYTDNAALIAGQYLRGFENNGVVVVGVGCDAADLPDDELAAAADECDEAIALAAGGTEPRYRAGGMISSRENAREVMTGLMAAMAGRHIDRGGEIVILPGVTRAAVGDFAEEDLLADEGVVWSGRRTADERVNCIASTFVNPDEGYQEAPLPPRKDADAITADGARFETGRAYRFVYSKTQGQRLDQIELRRARKEGFFACGAPLWAFEFTPGDTVTATNVRWGGTQKYFEIEGVGLAISSGAGGGQPQARAALSMREIGADTYAWSTADELTVTAAGITQPAAVASNFDAAGRLNGGAFAGLPLLTGAVATRNPLAVLTYADAGSTETVSIAAHTLKTSDVNGTTKTVSYNSGSVTGLAFSTGYHISAYDPTFVGGAVTYVAATSPDTYVPNNGYVYIGYIVTGADGGGSGGPPPPPPECVAAWAWVDRRRTAGEIAEGSVIDVLGADMASVTQARVDGAKRALVSGYRLVTTSGVTLTCSESTPITQPSGACVRARDALGVLVAVDDELGLRWETIVEKTRVGLIDVARIHVGGATYAAGDEPGRRMFTHNPLK